MSVIRSLAGLDRPALAEALAEIAEALAEIGVPERERKMRVSQLWQWLYARGLRDFDAMTNVSKDLRAKLKEHFTLERPEVVVEQILDRWHPQVADPASCRYAGREAA